MFVPFDLHLPCGAMAASVILYIIKVIIMQYISTTNTLATASPAPMPSPRERQSGSTLSGAETLSLDGTGQQEHTVVGKQIYGINEYIPNTLSTTAHIHTLLFQP